MIFPWSGYLKKTSRNLRTIISFIKKLDPDIIGLAEVDAGSYRSQKKNQAQIIATALCHRHTYMSKYCKLSLAHMFPIMNKQGNAFLTKDTIEDARFHYFEKGVKRLVIQLELKKLTVFLVHLALGYRARQHQLGDLYSMVKGTKKPHIVVGDFNAIWGDREIKLFLAATGLRSAAPSAMPTYPSWKPKRQLDFILYSPHITVTSLAMPKVTLSDHLPLVCDFEIER